MNSLNITDWASHSDIEKKLGILTNEGFSAFMDKLSYIATYWQESGLVCFDGLVNIVKFFKTVNIERDTRWGNTLIIDDYREINETNFDNKSDELSIKRWVLREMMTDVADMIDEGFRYGMENFQETEVLKDFLFYLALMTIFFQRPAYMK
ncbi:MAG: hypothetical protein K0Q87_192 [Neobacillus sp.]|jgi:hypothetical protein|nr:hypothetical protein [Neobacillus sp.]